MSNVTHILWSYLWPSNLHRVLLGGPGKVGEARRQPGQRHRALRGGRLPGLPGALWSYVPALLAGRPQQTVIGGKASTTVVVWVSSLLMSMRLIGYDLRCPVEFRSQMKWFKNC